MEKSNPDSTNAGSKLKKGNKLHFGNFKKHGTNIKFEGQITALCNQVDDSNLPRSCILLDNQSAVSRTLSSMSNQ